MLLGSLNTSFKIFPCLLRNSFISSFLMFAHAFKPQVSAVIRYVADNFNFTVISFCLTWHLASFNTLLTVSDFVLDLYIPLYCLVHFMVFLNYLYFSICIFPSITPLFSIALLPLFLFLVVPLYISISSDHI